MWRGVEQAEGGVRHHPGTVFGQVGVHLPQHADPGLHVAALCSANLPLGGGGKVGQIPILNPDQIRLTQDEVQVKVDQALECRLGVGGAGHDLLAALQ